MTIEQMAWGFTLGMLAAQCVHEENTEQFNEIIEHLIDEAPEDEKVKLKQLINTMLDRSFNVEWK